MLWPKYMYFRPLLVIFDYIGMTTQEIISYFHWSMNILNESWTLWLADGVMFERAIHEGWFECVEIMDQDHVTIDNRSCGTT